MHCDGAPTAAMHHRNTHAQAFVMATDWDKATVGGGAVGTPLL
jgi:hypothetical protein